MNVHTTLKSRWSAWTIPDVKTFCQEAKAWSRRMNRDGVKIAWKFDRKAARSKFCYKRKSFKQSQT